jgi:serine protease
MYESHVSHLSVRRAALAAMMVGAWLAVAGAPARAAAYAPHEVIVGYRRVASRDAVALDTRVAPAPGMRSPGVRSRVVRLPRHESVAAALRRLRSRAGVAYAEPDYVAHSAGAFYPDDRGRSDSVQGWEQLQWNMLPGTGVDAPLAWANLLADHRAGGRGVRIAVLDTGVAYRNWHSFRESPTIATPWTVTVTGRSWRV